MKTSHVAKDTAKVFSPITQAHNVPRRQTRSFATSVQAFTANSLPLSSTPKKYNANYDNNSPLHSSSTPDVEDFPLNTPTSSRKRKRGGLNTPSTALTTISTTTSTRTSPRKAPDGATGTVKKAKRQPAKRIVKDDGSISISPPANWKQIYDAVTAMRKTHLAPVDTMGCENHMENEALTPKVKRFHTLVSLMLSSQTKDTTNALTMARLRQELPRPGLTLETILECEPEKLNEMIWAVGFHNNKTKYIKAAAEILRDQYEGDIPDTVEGLMSLPGVGPKMAYLCLSAAWGRTEGIGVDVHVHRITNLWGWHKTKSPEETRASLEAWLPKERWHEINHLLVGFGQTICLPVGRRCGECSLAERGLCPAAVVDKTTSVKKVRREVEEKGIKGEKVKVEEEGVLVKEEELLADGSHQIL